MKLGKKLMLKIYKILYSRIVKSVIQTKYMNCKILVRPDEDVGLQILAGDYEKDDIRFLISRIRDGDVFIDIGANVGIFSLAVAVHNPTVKVHAFEPIPLNARLFEVSLILNEIKSVKLNQCCVGDRIGSVEFSLASDSAYSSIYDTGRQSEVIKLNTKITTLSAYVKQNQISRIDVMKIDVEGAEKLVIDGSNSILKDLERKPRLILMELYDKNFIRFDTSISDILSIMKRFGYLPFYLEGGQKKNYEKINHNKEYNVFFELLSK